MLEDSDIGPIVEKDWKRVEQLLAKGDEAAAALAVVEANKVFGWVLDLVSYGPNVDEMIRNAEGLFADVRKIMEARAVYAKILEEPNYVVGVKLAKQCCDALMAGILDMTGRDFEPRGVGSRLMNALNFFWGHHPKFFIGILVALLGLVGSVVFLADTALGQWLVRMSVGFARFVVASPALVIGLLVVLLIAWGSSWLLSGRVRRG